MGPSIGVWETKKFPHPPQRKMSNYWCRENYSLSIAPRYGVEPGYLAHRCLEIIGWLGWFDLLWLFFRSPPLLWVHDYDGHVTNRRKHSQHFSPSSSSYIMSASCSIVSLSLGDDGVNIKVPFRSEPLVLVLSTLTNYTSLNWLMVTAKRSFCEEIWEKPCSMGININI